MDENGYNFTLDTYFDDGDVVREYYVRQRSVNAAKRTWRNMEKLDVESGETWKITKFLVTAL